MIKKKKAAWYRLFSIVMVLTLLAGLVSPVVPAVAYAEDQEVVFTVEINGEEVEAYTLADLKAMPRKTKAYGATGFYVRAGVDFIDLLESLDIDYQNWTVKLIMTDAPSGSNLNFSTLIDPLLAYEESTGGSDFEPIPLKLYYGDGSNHKLVYQNVVGINVIKPESFTPPELVADSTDNTVGNPIELTFTDDEDWRNAINEVTVNGSAIASDDYALEAGKLTIDASVFAAAGEYTIVVKADGYEDAAVIQTLVAAPAVFTVEGNAVAEVSYTMAELKAMPATTKTFGNIECKGVDFKWLLESLDVIDDPGWTMKIKTSDFPNGINFGIDYALDPVNNCLLTYESDGSPVKDGPLRLYHGDGSSSKQNYKYVTGIIVTKPVVLDPPVLTADTIDNTVGNDIDITFTDDADWRSAISGITVDGSALTEGQYTVTAGNINIAAGVFTEAGDYAVVVSAAGYSDATVNQQVLAAPMGGEMQLSCDSGIPGLTVFISGSGFAADTAGTIWFDTNDNGALDGDEPSVAVTTDADGAIPLLTSLTVPSANTGSYTVRADIPAGGNTEAAADFTITGSGIIASLTSGNYHVSSDITITGSGFAPNTSFRLFCDRNGNGIFDDGAYRSGKTAADGTVSVSSISWPSAPTGIYNFLLDLNSDNIIEASASVCVIPGIKISTPKGVPGTNIGMNIAGFEANATGYVWFDTNGNGIWDEGENQAPVTTSGSGTATSPGLYVPDAAPGNYEVRAAIPARGLKASATSYTITGMVISPNSGIAGTKIEIAGYGFAPNQTSGKYIWFDTDGDGVWDENEPKVDVTVDASGTLSPASLTVPVAPAGSYNVRTNLSPSSFFAVFTLDAGPEPTTYPVTLAVDPAGSGSVTGAGEYAEGESVTVEAQAAEGYVFVNWTGAEGEVSTEASYTFTMPAEAVSLTANFEKVALEITGAGVSNPLRFTMTELEGMDQYRHLYSTNNTWPTKKWYVAEGVKLRDLLELAGIKGDAKQLRFVSRDGFKATFTVQELLNENRYIFPHFKENDEYAGHIPGSPEGAEPVETILALKSCEGVDFDYMDDGSALHLIFGQRWLTEQTNAVFAKYVTKVEVLTEDPGQWAVPTADKASGEVTKGTLVKLSSTYNDTDKVHYTLDGSEPTVESPMYNWIAQRWSSRSDFDEINHPIEITKDTTIKAVVIGPGRYDSDIATFEYKVVETVDVIGVSITEGNQELEVGKTVQLTAVVEPEDATNKDVTWSSSNESVATVDASGLVTAVSAGEATITVTTVDGGYSDSIVVNVMSVSDFIVENGVLVAYHGAGGDLIIPNDLNITGIGDNVFKDRSGLTSVIIPEGVTNIGKNAFDNCSNLHTVSIPESVVNIDNYAFIRCSSLSAITIPENVTYIGNNAFNGCSSLTEITIPGSVGTISMGTFDNCSGLETVTILEGVTIIDSHAFRNCSGLTSITLPENLVNIGSNAFNGCSSLEGVILPDSLESMGIGAFRKCSSLVTVTIPAKLTIIPVYAFEGCTGLAEVIISEGVTRINSWAFDNCSSLSKMVIPRSVSHIAGFAGCDQLTIHGYSGSYAETFANDNDIPFVALDAYNMLSVEAEPAALPIGDSFTVSVNVENIRDVQGYQVTLKYDPAYAEYKSHRVNFKPVTIDLETIKDGEITVGNFVLGDTPWEQDSGALVEIEFESRYPGTIEGGVYAFTFEEIEVVLEPRDSSNPAVRAKLDSPVVRYYEGSEVNIYAALELREDHEGITSTLQNGNAYGATTGSDGSATFETVRPGEYSLILEADGYLKAIVEGVVVSFGEENQVGTADVPVKLYVGDVNGDGEIDIIDISLAANKYGQTGVPGWVIEDLNLDGKVDISDLTAIARNYDMTTADTTYNYKDEAPYWE